jgi:hypothetical protein
LSERLMKKNLLSIFINKIWLMLGLFLWDPTIIAAFK